MIEINMSLISQSEGTIDLLAYISPTAPFIIGKWTLCTTVTTMRPIRHYHLGSLQLYCDLWLRSSVLEPTHM